MTATISLCMIVKNEEGYLEKCLNSVKNIADEIVIVDTGSKDKTKEIAKKFNAKIYDFKWDNNFSNARNFSLSKATKGWILVLDADESINKKDLKKIKELANKGSKENKSILGYSFVQRTYCNQIKKLKFNSAKSDIYDESKPFIGWNYRSITRLFRNDKRIKFVYPIHETVTESIKRIEGKIKPANIPIHHFQILKGQGFINKKSGYYTRLLKNKVKAYPNAKFYFELALELENLNKRREAKKYFGKAIELNPDYKRLYSKFNCL